MSLQQTLATKTGPFPYEIFLHVIDALIAEAEEAPGKKIWFINHNHNVSTKLVIYDDDIGPKQDSFLRERFRTIRLPSQINQKSRALVHQKFVRLPMQGNYDKGLSPVKGWVLPGVDYFIPYFARFTESLLVFERNFYQAVLLPTPAGCALLERVERIFLPGADYLVEYNATGIAIFSKMPNLRYILVKIGPVTDKIHEPMHPGIWPIDEERFPGLAHWAAHSAYFNKMWRSFQRRGVRLYAVLCTHMDPVMELVSTRKGIRMRYFKPNCTCCKTGTAVDKLINL